MNQNSVKTEVKEEALMMNLFIFFLDKDQKSPKRFKGRSFTYLYNFLQIFVDGLKYFYSNDDGKVDVTKLNEDITNTKIF